MKQKSKSDAVMGETLRPMKTITGLASDAEMALAGLVKKVDLIDVVSLSRSVAKYHNMSDGEACCWVTTRIQNEHIRVYENFGDIPPTLIVDERFDVKDLCEGFSENWDRNSPRYLNKYVDGFEFAADKVGILKADAVRCCAIPIDEIVTSTTGAQEKNTTPSVYDPAFPDLSLAIKGNQLKKIIEVWPVVQDILEVSRLDAVTFTERVFHDYRLNLYLDDGSLGLWFPVGNEDMQYSLMLNLGTSNFAHDPNQNTDGWENYRLLNSAYDKIIEVAKLITGQVSQKENTDFLDPKHPRYAPKLAAAFLAWQAVVDPGLKAPKQALTAWLNDNANKLGLCDKQGNLNKLGIDEVAKIANWKPEGGAPKTPG